MLVEARGVEKAYAGGASAEVLALKGVSVGIDRGEFVSIMGPSGSGKSTLLHLLGGLDRPTRGTVTIDGADLGSLDDGALTLFRRRRLGFVFQFFHLLPSMTALENVALPLLLDGKSFEAVVDRCRELIEAVGLGARANHRPDQLSGGEMQRVAIARALVGDPVLLLADEPTGSLDTATGESILSLLARLARDRGKTTVMVTHDPRAAAFGTRIVRLRDGSLEDDKKVPTVFC